MIDLQALPTRQILHAALMACALGQSMQTLAAGKAQDSAALASAVTGLIGDAACTSHEQCRTLAFGAKSCGGPQAYLAWSTLRSDEAALKAAAEKLAAAQLAEAKTSGMVSNCALVADPGAYCAPPPAAASGMAAAPERVCQLRSSRPAARTQPAN